MNVRQLIFGRRLVFWAAAMTISSPLTALCQANDNAGRPRLVCEKPTHDFGTVKNRDIVEHTFLLQNRGDADLVIDRVRTSCGCITTQLAKHAVPPGGETGIAAKLSLKGRSGRQDKYVYVHSNDPNSPIFKLKLAVVAEWEVIVSPNRLDLGRVSLDDPVIERNANITFNSPKQFHVTGLETNDLTFGTVTMKTVVEGRRYELKLKVTPGTLEIGKTFSGKAVVLTDHPEYASIEVPVTVTAQKFPEIIPPQIILQQSAPHVPAVRHLMVISHRNKPLEILRVETPNESIKVETQKLRTGRYRLKISNLGHGKDLDGKLFRIHVRKWNGKEEVIEVPVRVR